MMPPDFSRHSRYFGLDGLEVMSARWVRHAFAPHMHDFYSVSLNDGGRGAFDCRNEHHDAAPGTCNLIAPGELHTGQATAQAGWIYRNLHIEPALMATLLRSLDWQGPAEVTFRRPLVNDTVLASRLARVFASLTQSRSLLENQSLLLSVVARLISDHVVSGRAARNAGREPAPVRRVKEWLEAHSERNVSIHALADLAGLSPYYLVRAFHRHVGVPPHTYQRIVRLHRARKLLMSGASISETACSTGFCDQSHLNRFFKRTFGVTPGQFAASRPRPESRPIERRRGPDADGD